MKTKYFEIGFIVDLNSWGIGIDIGKTLYNPYEFYFSLNALCFCLIVWFWRNK